MLILASASPRRQELLRGAGVSFIVEPTNILEVPLPNETPIQFAERMAREKAGAAAAQRPDDFVLGADTIVVVDAEILGKPRDTDDAARMLRLLSGRTHEVITAVCLIDPHARQSEIANSKQEAHLDVRSEVTRVTMNPLADSDIAAYIATGEPMDKAGAYAIQGGASRWIPQIEGDYSNVVGLPVELVVRMLREHHGI
ncbi:MAG TPA: Maf family protein [Terriglobales bacterium]